MSKNAFYTGTRDDFIGRRKQKMKQKILDKHGINNYNYYEKELWAQFQKLFERRK